MPLQLMAQKVRTMRVYEGPDRGPSHGDRAPRPRRALEVRNSIFWSSDEQRDRIGPCFCRHPEASL
jgi:hypothetical protein